MKKLSKKILLIILFQLSSTQTFAYGDYRSSDEIFDLYSDQESRFSILVYFNGLGGGFSWANTQLESLNQQRLFCQPMDLTIGAEDYFKIYRSEYFKNEEIWGSFELQPPGIILLKGLINKYPCN
jgi:hypothetical protein